MLACQGPGDTPCSMRLHQDLGIIKVCTVVNGLGALPDARVNSSNLHAACSKQNEVYEMILGLSGAKNNK